MAGKSRRLGVVAFGKQSGIATPNTSPAWAVPIVSGGIGIIREREDIGVTSLVVGRQGQYVRNAHLDGTVTILAHPELLPFLLKHAMGTLGTTGAGPYVHTATLADDYPSPGFTFYSLVGDDWVQAYDCFIKTLTIRGEEQGNVTVEVGLDGKAMSDGAAAPTYSLTDVEPRFKFIGSSFKVDADTGVPVEVTNISAFELAIARDPEVRYGTSLTPSVITPERMVDASGTVVYDTVQQGWDFYRVAISGATGTPAQASQATLRGSFDITFGRHPVSAGRYLRLQSGTGVTGTPSQVWDYNVTRPEADPGGGSIEMDVAGPVLTTPGGATEATVIVANDTAGTAY